MNGEDGHINLPSQYSIINATSTECGWPLLVDRSSEVSQQGDQKGESVKGIPEGKVSVECGRVCVLGKRSVVCLNLSVWVWGQWV